MPGRGTVWAETLRWGNSGFSQELRGDPCSWREVSSLRGDFGRGVGFYKCHQAVLWLRVGNMNNLNHTFKDFSGFQDFSE